MGVRLRYDDVAVHDVEPDLEKATRMAVDQASPGDRIVMFTTYTAMWSAHTILQRVGQAV
jgi:hypothetical protein